MTAELKLHRPIDRNVPLKADVPVNIYQRGGTIILFVGGAEFELRLTSDHSGFMPVIEALLDNCHRATSAHNGFHEDAGPES